MPIKPENKNRYPDNWKQISTDLRTNRAKNRCEVCGIKNHLIIKRLPGGFYRQPSPDEWEMINSKIKYSDYSFIQSVKFHGFIKIILTTAHLDHTPENCEPENLKIMCQRCHNIYDREHRNQTRKQSKLKNQLSINFLTSQSTD